METEDERTPEAARTDAAGADAMEAAADAVAKVALLAEVYNQNEDTRWTDLVQTQTAHAGRLDSLETQLSQYRDDLTNHDHPVPEVLPDAAPLPDSPPDVTPGPVAPAPRRSGLTRR